MQFSQDLLNDVRLELKPAPELSNPTGKYREFRTGAIRVQMEMGIKGYKSNVLLILLRANIDP